VTRAWNCADSYRNENNFRQAKQDLMSGLQNVPTDGCGRRVTRGIDDLVAQVRAEKV